MTVAPRESSGIQRPTGKKSRSALADMTNDQRGGARSAEKLIEPYRQNDRERCRRA